MKISKVTSGGAVTIDVNPLPLDGEGSALVRFFRNTNTTGPKQVNFLRGNNSTTPSASIGVDGTSSFFQAHGGDVVIGSGTGGTSRLITPILEITGGSDFSEMFDVGGEAKPQAGMVVVIDPDNPGRLMPSTSPYDRKVAGIISGAGGVATGMTMGHVGTIADGEHPVALSGRVYCLVDASDAAIEPGDMLTTSSTPGHAMKADNAESANGAIIGKAMSGLAQGEIGLVLVLVNLQ